MGRPKSRQTTVIRVPEEYKALLLDFVNQLDRAFRRRRSISLSPASFSRLEKFTETTKDQSAKTLWDWLDLLIVPAFLAGLAYLFQQRDKEKAAERQDELKREREKQDELERERAKRQAELEREIAKDNRAEEAIQTYLDNMAKLLLDKELRSELFANDQSNSSDNDNSVKDVARTQTITILRRLEDDKKRRQNVIFRFLRDADLHKSILKNAHLSEMNLSETSLWNINLLGARLRNTNLSKADLEETNLSKANLVGADLEETNLSKANLVGANLVGAENLTPEQIKSACFWEKAIYKGEWHWDKENGEWKPENEQAEQENAKFIKTLEEDNSSNPKGKIDCSFWKK